MTNLLQNKELVEKIQCVVDSAEQLTRESEIIAESIEKLLSGDDEQDDILLPDNDNVETNDDIDDDDVENILQETIDFPSPSVDIPIDCKKYESDKWILIYDNREPEKIKNKFDNLNENNKNKFVCECRQMSVSDFCLMKYDQEMNTERPMMIFERKTWEDLRSSVFNGRIKKQRNKMKMVGNCMRNFIIEGKRKKVLKGFGKMKRTPVRYLEHFLWHSQIRDNFQIFYTENANDTVNFLDHAVNFFVDNNLDDAIPIDNNACVTTTCTTAIFDFCDITKKSLLNKTNFLQVALAQIPGITEETSATISNQLMCVYDIYSFKDFIEKISTVEQLSTIELSLSSNAKKKPRKVGNKMANDILSYFGVN